MKVYSLKKINVSILLVSLCLMGTSCGIYNNSSYAVQEGGDNEKIEDSSQQEDLTEQGSASIQVYTIDPDSLAVEEMQVMVDTSQGLTAQVVVDAVLDLLEAQGLDIGVNTVEQKDNTVTVDFDSQKAPLSGIGSAEETAILDCISMSLLDNLGDCQQVVFHADGDRYESGHYGFELNEAYKWKN